MRSCPSRASSRLVPATVDREEASMAKKSKKDKKKDKKSKKK